MLAEESMRTTIDHYDGVVIERLPYSPVYKNRASDYALCINEYLYHLLWPATPSGKKSFID